jgi:hypothetical protein
MPARARNVVVAAVAILAVLAGGAALLIGAGARSASVVQQQQSGNNACGWIGVKVSPMTAAFAESLGMVEPYGAICRNDEQN